MKTWQSLYAIIWLNFFVLFAAVFEPLPFHGHVHAVLGVLSLALAFRNKAAVARTACPARIKRIVGAVVTTSIMAAVTGISMAIPFIKATGWLFYPVLAFHLLAITAVMTQCASAATGFDMWEEKEIA